MAIKSSQGFELTSNEPIDARTTLTKEEMKSINENIMPDVYPAVCKDDGKLYIYNVKNTVNATTGKFRVYEGGGSGTSDYELLENQPQINNVTLTGNKTGDDLSLQGKMEALTVQEVQSILYNNERRIRKNG